MTLTIEAMVPALDYDPVQQIAGDDLVQQRGLIVYLSEKYQKGAPPCRSSGTS